MAEIPDYNVSIDEATASANYDWVALVIKLPFVSEILIGPTPIDFDLYKKYFPTFIHEEIHFIQNFYTSWGATVFSDYALSLAKIGASKITDPEMFEVPLVKSQIKDGLLSDGWTLMQNVYDRLNKGEYAALETDLSQEAITLHISEDSTHFDFLQLRKKISIKMIREHMAHLGSLLAYGYSDTEIHSFNNSEEAFLNSKSELIELPEYWVIFEYFISLKYYTNVAKGLFLACNNFLNRLKPEEALKRFLIFFQEAHKLRSESDFLLLVQSWQNTNTEILFKKVGYDKALKHLLSLERLTSKHMLDNDLMKSANALIAFSIENLKNHPDGLFSSNDDIQNPKFWMQTIENVGSCPITFTDKTLLLGRTGANDKLAYAFNYILAASKALKILQSGFFKPCPFLNDVPICEASIIGERCIRNPHLVIEADDKGGVCLFRSGILLLGIEDRLPSKPMTSNIHQMDFKSQEK